MGSLLDRVFLSDFAASILLGVMALGALEFLLGIRRRLSNILLLISYISVQQRLPFLNDGGDNLAGIMLFYLLFTVTPNSQRSPGRIAVWIHNCAVVLMIAQILTVYTTAGILKVSGDKWSSGVAMYYVSQVDWFSLRSYGEILKNSLIITLVTYLPVAHQLTFAVGLLTPVHLLWILFGLVFHLGVALYMGLITFSLAMMGVDLFLVTDADWEKIGGVMTGDVHAFGKVRPAFHRRADGESESEGRNTS